MRFSKSSMLAGVLGVGLSLGVAGWAAPATDSYQVTGPIIELTDSKIVIQKDDGKWEIVRDAATKVTGDLKVGSKVTVKYRMTAVAITAKEAK